MIEPPHDPFDDLVLDEAFVRSASRTELSAEARVVDLDRARAAHEELLRMRAAARAEAAEAAHAERWARRRARYGRAAGAGAALALLLVVSVWAMHRTEEQLYLDPVTGEITTEVAGPTLRAAPSAVPLGAPPAVPTGGEAAFVATVGGRPVTYDPCRPVAVVVNERTMPAAASGLVAEAVAEIGRRTGLAIAVEGETDERPREDRDPFQPDRYGDRWAPVLVAWSEDRELPSLGGAVVGFGGSTWFEVPGGGSTYVTGTVALDGPQLGAVIDEVGLDAARAVVLHELAHLVGLDHVGDPRELMYPEAQPGVVTFGPGDRWGLAQLGAGPCVDRL